MPTYTYQCQKCNEPTQVYHAMSATPKVKCASCGSSRMKRLLGTGAGIIFKGSGFYETDYKRSGGKDNSPAKSEGKSESASDSSKSESKTESKSESKTESKSTSADKPKAKKKD